MATLVTTLNAKVEAVTVDTLQGSTFIAKIRIMKRKIPRELDCRSSDAIALALNVGCPIYVSEEVMTRAESYPQKTEPSTQQVQGAAEILTAVLQQAGKGLQAAKNEEEIKAFLETRRAFVAHINGLIARQ